MRAVQVDGGAVGAIVEVVRAGPGIGDEARAYSERRALTGRGIGYIDVHLLACADLSGVARLWTRDRRLAAVDEVLDPAFDEGRAKHMAENLRPPNNYNGRSRPFVAAQPLE